MPRNYPDDPFEVQLECTYTPKNKGYDVKLEDTDIPFWVPEKKVVPSGSKAGSKGLVSVIFGGILHKTTSIGVGDRMEGDVDWYDIPTNLYYKLCYQQRSF